MEYSIKIGKGIEENPDVRIIRQQVFVEEQGFVNEFDKIDEDAFQLVIYYENEPVATGRLFFNETPAIQTIGRVSVLKPFRGKSLGKEIISNLEKIAKKNDAKIVQLSAQERVKGFYEKLGYNVNGTTFLEESCPHVLMEKVMK